MKKIVEEGREATREEQAILVKYVGWGALANVFDPFKREWEGFQEELKQLVGQEEYEKVRASTKNAHYTSRHFRKVNLGGPIRWMKGEGRPRIR